MCFQWSRSKLCAANFAEKKKRKNDSWNPCVLLNIPHEDPCHSPTICLAHVAHFMSGDFPWISLVSLQPTSSHAFFFKGIVEHQSSPCIEPYSETFCNICSLHSSKIIFHIYISSYIYIYIYIYKYIYIHQNLPVNSHRSWQAGLGRWVSTTKWPITFKVHVKIHLGVKKIDPHLSHQFPIPSTPATFPHHFFPQRLAWRSSSRRSRPDRRGATPRLFSEG